MNVSIDLNLYDNTALYSMATTIFFTIAGKVEEVKTDSFEAAVFGELAERLGPESYKEYLEKLSSNHDNLESLMLRVEKSKIPYSVTLENEKSDEDS